MIKKYVRVKNASEERRRIEDFQLPCGYLELEAGEEATIPSQVYIRVARRYQEWLRNLDSASMAAAEAESEQETQVADTGQKRKSSKRGKSAE